MSEMNIQLSANDLALFKSYRQEYAETAASIASLKEDQKMIFESLFDKMGLSTKEHKAEMKAIKQSFKLYVKGNAEQCLAEIESASELAQL